MKSHAARLDAIEQALSSRDSNLTQRVVVGIVHPDRGLTHSIEKIDGEWVAVTDEPNIYLASKLERVLKSTKRIIVVFGGRGSGKSVGAGGSVPLIDCINSNAKTYCLREHYSNIESSVYAMIKSEISRLELGGFTVQATSILYNNIPAFKFAGIAKNSDAIKSSFGFKRFCIEEAQFISEQSLIALTPTARNKPNKGLPRKFTGEIAELAKQNQTQMIFIGNMGSAEDPFSKRFINPFVDVVKRDGFYEDDMHLIVKMNYGDNPWYEESGLEQERQWDKKYREPALYAHIWDGEPNDTVANALILSEWFDACIDAHLKLGFEPAGAKLAAHDPSDTGPDSKGYAMRHGSVVLHVFEKDDGNVNEGGHWAADLAMQHKVDQFTWDCDGMGIALNEQISASFVHKKTDLVMFKGSETPDNPDNIYKPSLKSPFADQKRIKDTVKNKRAQYSMELRDRCYRTYRAVVHGEYSDPDLMISFSSAITELQKLRSEVCRMPVKENKNGKVELYTKAEMKVKFKVPSPNLFDSVMMLMRYRAPHERNITMPQAIMPRAR